MVRDCGQRLLAVRFTKDSLILRGKVKSLRLVHTVAMLTQPGRSNRGSWKPPVMDSTLRVRYAFTALIERRRTTVAWGV